MQNTEIDSLSDRELFVRAMLAGLDLEDQRINVKCGAALGMISDEIREELDEVLADPSSSDRQRDWIEAALELDGDRDAPDLCFEQVAFRALMAGLCVKSKSAESWALDALNKLRRGRKWLFAVAGDKV